MEEELRKQLELALAQGGDAALQCFDTTGLPLLTVGKCSFQASNVLPSIYRHALLVTDSEGEKPPVVILERERNRILMAQSGGYITAVHRTNPI